MQKNKDYYKHKIDMVEQAMRGTTRKITELTEQGADSYLIDAQVNYLKSCEKEKDRAKKTYFDFLEKQKKKSDFAIINELRNCPFCFGHNLRLYKGGGSSPDGMMIKCETCGARSGYYLKKENLITVWNNRE